MTFLIISRKENWKKDVQHDHAYNGLRNGFVRLAFLITSRKIKLLENDIVCANASLGSQDGYAANH